jgi:DNA replication protein DnaC
MNNIYKDSEIRLKKFNIIIKDDEEVLVPNPEWTEFKNKKSLDIKLKSSNIPSYVLDLTIKDILKEDELKIKLSKYLKDFDKKFRSIHLYFWSNKNGTQKTTSASILAKELILKGFNVKFILMSELTKLLLKESFEEVDEEINTLLNCDFLVIDDCFDPKKVTIYKSGYQIPFLDTFLRNRLELKRKATCFTSNYSLNEIDENTFGTSLVKLLQRQIIDPFNFKTPYSLRNDFSPNDLWS